LGVSSQTWDDELENEFSLHIRRFVEAIQELLNAALIRHDPSTGVYSTHRLLQEVFRDWLKKESLMKCFRAASALLLQAFPKHLKGRSLRNEWSTCKLYVQHVLTLCARCHEDELRVNFWSGDTTDCQVTADIVT
jgi:hypothetical protein